MFKYLKFSLAPISLILSILFASLGDYYIWYFFIGFSFQQYLPLVTVMILVGFLGTYLGKLVLISKGQNYFKKILSIILFFGAIRLIYFGFQNPKLVLFFIH